MKKNTMMRLASVLLVAVLLTTCAISGTWAKYTSSDFSEDSARVAKWGVTVRATSTAFKEQYEASDDTVLVKADEPVVAPGTAGELAKFAISGTPEVAVELKYEATLTLDGWTLSDGTPYCPIVFRVNNIDYAFRDGAHGDETLEAFAGRVKQAIEDTTDVFGVENTITDVLTVSWSWSFTGVDANDTYLGNQAAEDNASGISLEVTCAVNQYTK